MISLLVQLAICFAIANTLKCCKGDLDDVTNWKVTDSCTRVSCANGVDKCFITKTVSGNPAEVSYTMGCMPAAQLGDCKDAGTHCCDDADGCNWLHLGEDKEACQSQVTAAKTECQGKNANIHGCMAKVTEARMCNQARHCHTCANLDAAYFDTWNFAGTCPLSQCGSGQRCFITKTPGNKVSYQMGCKAVGHDDANTKYCDTDGCNNGLDVGAVRNACQAKVNAAKSTCNNVYDVLHGCMAKVISARACNQGVWGMRGGLGLPLMIAISMIVLVILQ
ncbi:uncharacterized protein LOC129183039 [Dunckerocampus dactyliophorus]|uniref:uncharacterized protein LOC129183039 n=1 Tax=Dunckerocampus dactyliophorus TaxID=161453 RepID=UPI002406444E|nr:uncharacterized protein LOC129183039 [Dunckerocampus dactyliophorus]